MADEDGVERLRHEGRVHRWQRRGSAWPGHITFVAIRAGEVVVGDRYAGEGIERTYACHPQALLDGCFQALVGEQLGADVLAELLNEVQRELGPLPLPASQAAVTTKTAHEGSRAAAAVGASSVAASGKDPVRTAGAGAQRASAAEDAKRPAAEAEPAPAAGRTGLQAPAAARAPAKDVSEHPTAGPVDVAVVACRAVDLPLAVELRAIMRTPVQELLARLRSLPCRVAAGVPLPQAKALATRLSELGAEVRLVPTGAS